MANQLYNWTRFWIPHGEEPRWDGGFLAECQSKIARLLNPKPVTLESVEANVSCLVLLGEPGIGKSKELEKQNRLTESCARETGDEALFFKLGIYSTDSTLCKDVFENSILERWTRGTNNLYLFLDSLDEGLLAINALTRLLARKLNDLPANRLRLRITCRTAEWQSSSFGDELVTFFGRDAVKVFDLLPLCRSDAESAAKQEGLDPSRFMTEVTHKDVEAFASKPLTLNLLIKLFKKHNTLPKTQSELYFEGCRALCEDTDDRKEARRTGTLSADQRLILAARIAAITIFGNRSSIWLGKDAIDAGDEDVVLRDLCDEIERRDGETVPTNQLAVLEVLEHTGVFTSGGQHRLRWGHQTYAEFLAARYLCERNMSLNQKLDLILHHGDPEKKVVPQLHETAAWLAGMDQAVFEAILQSEPEVLLRSDVAKADASDRERLVGALLNIHEEERRQAPWFPLYVLKKLSHPCLADQLRPYITAPSKWIVARQLAIHIAHACETIDLQGVLADLALDAFTPLDLRCDAARAVGDMANHETMRRLRPLIADSPSDPEKQLKGYALQALWPTCLTTEELFDSLTSGTPWFTGSYDHFVYSLAERLRPPDLLPALAWLREQPHREEAATTFHTLKDAIVLIAWEHCDIPGVIESFAKVALSRLMSYEPIIENRSSWDDLMERQSTPPFPELVSGSDTNRRAVLKIMIALLSEHAALEDNEAHIWAFSHNNPFLLGGDLYWFVEQFENATSDIEREILALLISWVFHWNEVDHVDILYEAVRRSVLIAHRFGHLFAAIGLDSAEATELRTRYHRDVEMRETRAPKRPMLTPSPTERIVDLLDQFETGKYDAWWQLNYFMRFLPDGTGETGDYHPDLRSLPGWQSADEQTKTRIRRAAEEYLLHGEPATKTWIEKDEIHRPSFAGYKAIYLLASENPDSITINLSSASWRTWAPVVLAFPSTGRQEAHDLQLKLIVNAYRFAPNEIIATLKVLIDRETKQYEIPQVIDKVEGCWDDQIASALRETLIGQALKPGTRGYLLGKLLIHDGASARELAESYCHLPPKATDADLSMAVAAGRALMLHTRDGDWPFLWPRIGSNSEFGWKLIEGVAGAGEARKGGVAPDLGEQELAEFYIWLERNYPHSEDPDTPTGFMAYEMTPRRLVGKLRDSILRRLEDFGSALACEHIRKIVEAFPELEWMRWVLRSAQANTRRTTWEPPKPSEIMQLANDSNSGLVQSGEQLLRIVIESLRQLDAKLQLGAATAHELWNEDPDCKPKDEIRLAQKVETHLTETLTPRGIVANREVVVRRGRTDVHIDAIIKAPNGEVYDRITLIIEVKGCWHSSLKKAMKAQLVARYLAENRCDYGLYLVGWFICDQWASEPRKSRTPKWNLREAQAFFDEQAKQCTKDGKVVRAFVLNASL